MRRDDAVEASIDKYWREVGWRPLTWKDRTPVCFVCGLPIEPEALWHPYSDRPAHVNCVRQKGEGLREGEGFRDVGGV